MAKSSSSISFSNATINKEEDTITEIKKEGTNVYKLSDVISSWDLVEGISITIKKDEEVKPVEGIEG